MYVPEGPAIGPQKNAIGLKKRPIGLNAPLPALRFLEKIVLISTETLYIVLVYIHTYILTIRPSHYILMLSFETKIVRNATFVTEGARMQEACI